MGKRGEGNVTRWQFRPMRLDQKEGAPIEATASRSMALISRTCRRQPTSRSCPIKKKPRVAEVQREARFVSPV